MALVPYLVFDDLLRPLTNRWNSPLSRNMLRHHRDQCHILESHFNKDGFKVNLDVQQFHPDEISVKMVDDFVVVEGKHEEHEDEHGYISRHFQRRYKLRSDIDPDTVTSKLSSDGILTITAPKKHPVPLPGVNERIVPITPSQEFILNPGMNAMGKKQSHQ